MYHNHPTASLSRQEQLRGHLPSWQRSCFTDQLRKGGKLRQLQPNPVLLKNDQEKAERNIVSMDKETQNVIASQEKILMLERRLQFLRSQHSDTLTHLHRELDKLKADNKELNFKLVMCRCGMSNTSSARGNVSREAAQRSRQLQRKSTPNDKGTLENRRLAIEDEVEDLKGLLQREKRQNAKLTRVVEKMMQRSLGGSDSIPKGVILMNTGHALSSDEYREIIEHLILHNEQQEQEIVRLKKDFHDLLCSDSNSLTKQLDEIQGDTDSQTVPPQGIGSSSTHSRVVLPYITLKEDNRNKHSPRHPPVHLPSLRVAPPPAAPGSLLPNRHRRTNPPLQRTRLGTFPR